MGAVLRASHVGQEVTFEWRMARPLETDEHFHLLKSVTHPDANFAIATPVGHVELSHVDLDPVSWLQFFDLRVANSCEEQSAAEFSGRP